MSTQTQPKQRHLPYAGAYNIRDLGGYPLRGGGETRWRQLLRADALHRLDAAEARRLAEHGVVTVIDLRRQSELDAAPNPFAAYGGVDYHHVSLFDQLALLDLVGSTLLHDLYCLALRERGEAFAQVLRLIADAPDGIVLFHCTAGKDRTGMIAALLLLIAEADHEAILGDYAMTGALIAPMLDELIRDAAARGEDVDAFRPLLACTPETMAATLAELDRAHGGIDAYLAAIGLDDVTVAKLRARLVSAPRRRMTMSKLSLRGVRKTYDKKQVVHGVDLEVPNGAFVVIVGPSGCGKSTLLRMVAGLEDITDGEIAIDGMRVNEREPSERGCAMVFQNYALYPHMTVAQNIEYPLKIAGVPRAERTKRMRETADILDLGDYLDRRPGQLSGGQRQRVAMGRAIVREPSIFLFDEPLSNLDAKLRVQMRIEIRRLHRRLGATSIFVTHDQVEAMTLADILVVMNNGKVEQIGSPSDVYRTPASTFVAAFTGSPAMNLLPATIVEPGRATLDAWPDLTLAVPGEALRGQRVIVGIRPEDVVVGRSSPATLPASLDLVEDTGGSMTGFFALGEAEVAAVLDKTFSARSGDFGLSLPLDAISPFDAGTGLRLGDLTVAGSSDAKLLVAPAA